MLEYAPYAKRVAEHLGKRVPPNVDRSDLVSWGIVGLIDALDKFDPARGIKFESYAVTRIRGAIIDALRSEDWIPRAVRRDTRGERCPFEAGERAAPYTVTRGGRVRAANQ